MSKLHQTDDITALASINIQRLVLMIPGKIATDIAISTPPEKRDIVVFGFLFTAPSLSKARDALMPD